MDERVFHELSIDLVGEPSLDVEEAAGLLRRFLSVADAPTLARTQAVAAALPAEPGERGAAIGKQKQPQCCTCGRPVHLTGQPPRRRGRGRRGDREIEHEKLGAVEERDITAGNRQCCACQRGECGRGLRSAPRSDGEHPCGR